MPNRETTCGQKECSRTADGGRGYCKRHYAAWKRGKLPKARYKTCRVEACHKRAAARGRCDEHFARDYPGRRSVAAPAEAAPTS